MIEIDKEKILNKYPSSVTINETELILKQMKNNICKIQNKNGNGTGFFCKILNKKTLITNNHVIDEEVIKNKNIINVKLNDDEIKKNIKIKDYYTSEKYDTTIIEIEDEDINYLEIDDDIFDDYIDINNKNIYIIQYPKYYIQYFFFMCHNYFFSFLNLMFFTEVASLFLYLEVNY